MFGWRRALQLVRNVELDRMNNNGFGFAAGILFFDELPHITMAIDNDMVGMLMDVKSDERNDRSFLRGNTFKIGFEVVFQLVPILVLERQVRTRSFPRMVV